METTGEGTAFQVYLLVNGNQSYLLPLMGTIDGAAAFLHEARRLWRSKPF